MIERDKVQSLTERLKWDYLLALCPDHVTNVVSAPHCVPERVQESAPGHDPEIVPNSDLDCVLHAPSKATEIR